MLILQQVPHLPLIAVDTHRRQTGFNAFVPGQHVLFGIVQKLIQNPGTERIQERVKGEKNSVQFCLNTKPRATGVVLHPLIKNHGVHSFSKHAALRKTRYFIFFKTFRNILQLALHHKTRSLHSSKHIHEAVTNQRFA